MEKFWKWLRRLSNKKVKKHYLKRVHHDRLCIRCKTWTSEIDGCSKLETSDDGNFEFLTCKKCNYVSKWNITGIIPVVVKDQEA
jgi:hypothetical protein